jgi:hypothetical protein
MCSFVQQHLSSVIGLISGWDRMRFRGTLRLLANVSGLRRFLSYTHHLLKDFGKFAPECSRVIREASLEVARDQDRPVVHLPSPSIDKEAQAREIAKRDGVKEGLICVLTAVEACGSFNVRSNKEAGKLELIHCPRKCQHLYHYFQHPIFGFMHVRLQTWLPFNQFICINGREWLSRQMDQAGISYVRKDNCFTWISDVEGAQKLLEEQVSFNYEKALGELGRLVNPALEKVVGGWQGEYYWSIEESEWATDLMFKSERELSQLYPALVRHGIQSFASPDVMRFLGHRVTPQGGVHGNFEGEVVSDVKRRAEGVRIKHRLGGNSVKMYNKQGSVLRMETTLNNMRELKAMRQVKGKTVWMKMRKGVCDIARRAEVSDAANKRYLDAMAAVSTPTPLKDLTGSLGQATNWNGRRVRGLNLLGEDARLLEAVAGGEFLIHGFRNKDVQAALFAKPTDDPTQKRKRCGQITRKLRMLRAHGLIAKVSRTHRYLVTEKGRQVIAGLLAAREADIAKLLQAA